MVTESRYSHPRWFARYNEKDKVIEVGIAVYDDVEYIFREITTQSELDNARKAFNEVCFPAEEIKKLNNLWGE